MKDIIALGEALVDLKLRNEKLSMHAGGSVLNFSFYAEQAGAKVKFIGTIGDDFLADLINEELLSLNSKLEPIRIKQNTTLVLIKRAGREFIIYRGADRFLTEGTIEKYWEKAKIVHTSAFALSLPPAREAIFSALVRAKKEGALISIDPNYRKNLWEQWGTSKDVLLKAISMADYVKPSMEDARELFGAKSPNEALGCFKKLGARNVILSMGEKGVIALDEEENVISVPAEKTRVVELTGAGDSLFGTIMAGISQRDSLKEAIERGIKTASKVVASPRNPIKI